MISRIKDKSLQVFIHALCVCLMLSVSYDMSFAFKKIITQSPGALYVSIFVFMALVQTFFIGLMLYSARTKSHKVPLAVGLYLTFTPLFLVVAYAVTKSDEVFILSSYLLPMFHRVSFDLSNNVFFIGLNILSIDKIIFVALTLIYAISLLTASNVFKKY